MGKGYRIKDNYKDPHHDLFVSMGSTHEERVKNYRTCPHRKNMV